MVQTEERMASHFDRRSVLKIGGAAAASSLLLPHTAWAQQANINYWHTFTSQSEFTGLERVMALFHENNPDIRVTQENIPNPEYMAKVTAATVAGSLPDTLMVAAERFADLLAMGALTDITERVEGWEARSELPDDRFAGMSRDGKVYGVPAFAFVQWLYYRKDWFDEAGIAVPTTWEELGEAARRLSDPANGRYGFGMRGGAGGQNFIIDIMDAWGSPIINEAGEVGLDRERAIEGLTWYTDLYKDQAVPPSAPNDSFRQIMEAFQTGQTAMVWHHTGSFRDISNMLEPGVEFGTMAVPSGPNGRRIGRVSYAFNSISKPDNADAAWQWLTFWNNSDAAVAFLEETGYFPANPKVAEDPRIADNPLYAPAAETLSFGSLPPSAPGLAGWSENIALPALQRIMIGEASVEEAVDEMIAGLQDVQ